MLSRFAVVEIDENGIDKFIAVVDALSPRQAVVKATNTSRQDDDPTRRYKLFEFDETIALGSNHTLEDIVEDGCYRGVFARVPGT